MNEFNQIRKFAKDKRDKIVSAAQEDYESALRQIAALQLDLMRVSSTRSKKASAAIDLMIPKDEEFTIAQIMTSLEASEPTRAWSRSTVDNHIAKLRGLGIVRRIRRAKLRQKAVYIRTDATKTARPFDDLTLRQAIETVGSPGTELEFAL